MEFRDSNSEPQLTPIPGIVEKPRFPASIRILRKIGEGGMSKIYQAIQEPLERKVALKILTATAPDSVARFEREARLLAGLDHENLVHVYDFMNEPGQRHLIMEYVEGTDLSRLIADGKLPPRIAAWIAAYLARALAYLHGLGIIHRDIKPGNVILSHTGRVKLIDFGIAKHIHDPQLSADDTGVGTPLYMSPERLQGQMADARSDLYSLGVLLYRLLAGRLPFEENETSPPLFEQIQSQRPAPVPGVPPALQRIVMRCLEKRPDDRYLDANRLRADLEQFLAATGDPLEGEMELLAYLESRGRVPAGTTQQKKLLLQLAGRDVSPARRVRRVPSWAPAIIAFQILLFVLLWLLLR